MSDAARVSPTPAEPSRTSGAAGHMGVSPGVGSRAGEVAELAEKTKSAPRFEFAQFSQSIQVPASFIEDTRTYGPVRRNGKTFYRNYGRYIKDGLTPFDLMEKLREKAHRARCAAFNRVMDRPPPGK